MESQEGLAVPVSDRPPTPPSRESTGSIIRPTSLAKSSVSTMPFTSSFHTLQERFEAVLADISGEGSLLRFREQYERLHEALLDSMKNEKRLHSKYQELQLQIQKNADKVQTAIQLSVDDQNTIYLLNEEVKKAWGIVEELHQKDKKSRETILKLTKEVTELSQLVDQGMGLEKRRRKQELIKLVKEKEKVYEDNIVKRNKLNQLKKHFVDLRERYRALKKERDNRSGQLKQAKERGLEQINIGKREKMNKNKAMKTLEAKERVIEKLQEKVRVLQRDQGSSEAVYGQKLLDLKEEQDRFSDLKNHLIQVRMDNEELKHDVQLRQEKNVELDLYNKKFQSEMTEKKKLLNQIESELSSCMEKRERLLVDIGRSDDKEREVRSSNCRTEGRIFELEGEIRTYQAQILSFEHELDRTEYLKSKISSRIVTLSNSKESEEVIKSKLDEAVRSLKESVFTQNEHFEHQKKTIIDLKKVREKHSKKAHTTHRNLKEQSEHNKIWKLKNDELAKSVNELRDKLKEANQMYEVVRRERNNYSRQYTDSQEQIYEMRKKYSLLSKQIKHLREEIASCEKLKEEGIKRKNKTDRAIDKLKEEKDKNNEVFRKYVQDIKNVKVEVEKLKESVAECQKTKKDKLKILKDLIEQRDLLSVQIIRRNDECALLKEKIKVQEKFLDRGNTLSFQRNEDSRILKIMIMEYQRTLFVRSMQVEALNGKEEDLEEVLKELKEARLQVKAISENLENPQNRNRWRALGRIGQGRGKWDGLKKGRESKGHHHDPNNKNNINSSFVVTHEEDEDSDEEGIRDAYLSSYEIARKIQSIQKRLIRKSEEAVELDLVVDKKKRMVVQLREIMKRQPNPRLAQQLNIKQKKLIKTTNQMKSIAAELNYINFEKKEKRFEIDRLNRLTNEIEKQYYMLKKRRMGEVEKIKKHRRMRKSQVMRGVDENDQIYDSVIQDDGTVQN